MARFSTTAIRICSIWPTADEILAQMRQDRIHERFMELYESNLKPLAVICSCCHSFPAVYLTLGNQLCEFCDHDLVEYQQYLLEQRRIEEALRCEGDLDAFDLYAEFSELSHDIQTPPEDWYGRRAMYMARFASVDESNDWDASEEADDIPF
jgi:hypothetical protein